MKRHTQKDHGLTEKGNVIENSAGIAIFTTEALVKEKVSETRAKRLLHQCEKCQYSTVQKVHLKRHGCFPAKRKERFFYTRWLEIEKKKPKSFVGPLSALD